MLQLFDGAGLSEDQLTEKFKEIARAALYGGCFVINKATRDEYKIYIHEVEFYFHSENENKEKRVCDWAMYHRNSKDILPYFPVGSLHPHKSGVDVTFENEEKQYRASFLIRKYEERSASDEVRNKPSYLCEDLFGYTGCLCGDGPRIEWENIPYGNGNLKQGVRINLSAYDENGNLCPKELITGKQIQSQDTRKWRFFK